MGKTKKRNGEKMKNGENNAIRKNRPISVLILILTAMIWGTAFVAQNEGGDAVGVYTFICVRSVITSAVMGLLVWVLKKRGTVPETTKNRKSLWVNGFVCGICLYLTSLCQQLGMRGGTPVGKAGFLTACYVVLVPVLGLFLKRRCGRKVWVAVAVTVVGLYLLCMEGDFSFQGSDLIVLGAAVACAVQIHVIDRCIDEVDAVRLSLVQFLTAAVLGLLPMLLELFPKGICAWSADFLSKRAMIALLYTGVLSGAGGYTLQMVGQKGCEPATASILMSLESVFSVLAGWLLLNQVLSARELLGCALIFIAVILAQIPQKISN